MLLLEVTKGTFLNLNYRICFVQNCAESTIPVIKVFIYLLNSKYLFILVFS